MVSFFVVQFFEGHPNERDGSVGPTKKQNKSEREGGKVRSFELFALVFILVRSSFLVSFFFVVHRHR